MSFVLMTSLNANLIHFKRSQSKTDRTRSRKNEAISSNKSSPIKNKEYSANGRTSQSNGIIAIWSRTDSKDKARSRENEAVALKPTFVKQSRESSTRNETHQFNGAVSFGSKTDGRDRTPNKKIENQTNDEE